MVEARNVIRLRAMYMSAGKFKSIRVQDKDGFINQSLPAQMFVRRSYSSDSILVNGVFSLLRLPLSMTGTGEKFNGDLALRTAGGGIKIFSFRDGLILNFVADEQKYLRLKRTYEYYSTYFRTPVISSTDSEFCFVERLIGHVPSERLSREQHNRILDTLVTSTLAHISSLDKGSLDELRVVDVVDEFYRTIGEHKVVYRLLSMIPEKKQYVTLPEIPCHGDATYDNMLLDGCDVYSIDWEYACSRVFYYDPIYMIAEPYIYPRGRTESGKIFSAHHLQSLNRLFSSFGIELSVDTLPFYLALALMQRLTQMYTGVSKSPEYDLACLDKFLDRVQNNGI